jgi:hypothetical protein
MPAPRKATNNIEVAAQRQAADLLRPALPEDITIERRFIPEPPGTRGRLTILPSDETAVAEVQFLGGARTVRDESFTVVFSCEAIGDKQEPVEDTMKEITDAVEDLAANYPTLGDLDGMTMVGVHIERTTHPVVQLDPGVIYQWVEINISARGRYE